MNSNLCVHLFDSMLQKKTTLEKVNQQVKSDPPRNKKVLWDTKILVLITLKVATK